ncbi:MAG TPA: hypothetical protein VN932_01805 [Rhizomicrobium sp.]|nr:hypothetical protein [Rhizomicrobium sp.]
MKIRFGWNRKDKFGPLSISVEECLSKEEANKLRQQDFNRIIHMTSEERLKLFATLFGERKAAFVNSRLESDMILPNQKAGLMNWINGIKDVEPKWRKEIVREISALDKALNESEMEAFMEKLAELKLGVGVTLEEAQMIFDLSKAANEAKKKFETGGSVFEYDLAKKALDEYVVSLKPET